MRRVIIAGYLLEIAFNLSGRLVVLETNMKAGYFFEVSQRLVTDTGHDSWLDLLTRYSFQFVWTTGGS